MNQLWENIFNRDFFEWIFSFFYEFIKIEFPVIVFVLNSRNLNSLDLPPLHDALVFQSNSKNELLLK